MTTPLIALIHATPLAMRPAAQAFGEVFGEAEVWNILEDQLLPALNKEGALTDALAGRMLRLIDYARDGGADGILVTCSGYSPVVDAAKAKIDRPVLKPDEAMYDQVIAAGAKRVGLLTTAPGARAPAEEQIRQKAEAAGARVEVRHRYCPDAMEAQGRGDDAKARDILVRAAAELAREGVEEIILAQYSMVLARDAVERETGLTVRTGPHAAALRLREHFGRRGGEPGGRAV